MALKAGVGVPDGLARVLEEEIKGPEPEQIRGDVDASLVVFRKDPGGAFRRDEERLREYGQG